MAGALRWFIPLSLLLLLAGCANIVPPTGGDKDITPPKLLSISPADSQLNVRPKKLELRFDEYVVLSDAASQVQISPLLPIPLLVTSALRHVTVVIPDSLLQPQTTYRITFGNAIRDLNEGNIYQNKGYTFSTGDHFDSLSLAGSVFDARTGLRDSAAQVVLYAASESDSAVVRHKPLYVTHVDAAGNFSLQGLPSRPFRIYAMRDANSNLTFDGGNEAIAFSDSIVNPAAAHIGIELRTFSEPATDTSNALKRAGLLPVKSVPPGAYKLSADTTDPKHRTQDLDAPLSISFGRQLSEPINKEKVFLSYDSVGTTIEAPFQLSADSTGLRYNLNTPWIEDAVYTLRLQKGFAKDSSNGTDMLPGRYTFRTKRDEDYGKLSIHLPTQFYGRAHILQVTNEHDTVYQKPVADTIVNLKHLAPGTYSFRVIEDKNENGRWDAGNLFLRRQPEYVIPYDGTVNLKAGWEQQIDFEEPKKKGQGNLLER